MSTQQKRWSDLSPMQRKAVIVGGALELVVTSIAAADLRRRDSSQVRGPKAMWVCAFVVQPFGPLAYLLLGRR